MIIKARPRILVKPQTLAPVSRPLSMVTEDGKLKKFWDMERDGVTQSSMAVYALCPMKAHWRMIKGLKHDSDKDHSTQFGSYFHEVVDKVYSQKMIRADAKASKLDTMKYWSMLSTPVLEKTYKQFIVNKDPFDQQAFEVTFGLCNVVLRRYFKRWGQDDRAADTVAVERVMEFPYRLRNGVVIRVLCKVDRIDRTKEGLWVYDHKTKSQIEDNHLVEKMSFDLQMMVYCLCVYHNYGEWPKGIVYNLIKRPAQKFTGTYYKKPETLDAFLERVDSHMEKKGDDYFCRYTISLLPKEIESFRDRDLDYLIERYYEFQQGGIVPYRNSGACSMWNRPCEYLPLCSGEHGAIKQYSVREHPFPELVNDEEADGEVSGDE